MRVYYYKKKAMHLSGSPCPHPETPLYLLITKYVSIYYSLEPLYYLNIPSKNGPSSELPFIRKPELGSGTLGHQIVKPD